MKTLQDHLTKAGEEVRLAADQLPPVRAPQAHPARNRLVAGVVVAAAIAALVLPLILLNAPSSDQISPSDLGQDSVVTTSIPVDSTDGTPAEDRFVVATGVFVGSSGEWELTAWETEGGEVCADLGGIGCFMIAEGSHLSGMFVTAPAGAGPRGWCGYGTVVNAASVQIVLAGETTVNATVVTHPEFGVDFFVHCQTDGEPAGRLAAIGADGTTLEELP